MKEKVAAISILANIVLATGKMIIGFFSNSAAILAEGIHSFMDIFSSFVSYLGIKISQKPEDKTYPYGRYKFEVLGGVVITIILLITGIGIVYEAYKSFLNPEKININYLAFGVMIFSAIINELMARLKIYYGKKENSISLLSDGIHSRVDVYASLAVFAGLFLTKYWIYADSLLAFLIGIYIIKESFSLGKEAADSLLDVSAGKETEEEIKKIAKEFNIDISRLKTQKKGLAIAANLEIKLPSNLRVEEATNISDNLREKLIKRIEGLRYVDVQITSHEVRAGFYKPNFGKSFEWQRKGKFKEELKEAKAEGPGGFCICKKCGYKIIHKRGVPCSGLKCPKCKKYLIRG
ncbi:MAG: cation diffusion facilitator family transporter [Candidatus Pacebacteria bacterium]|nr:cation diffusion facilitator family transporter [Candidatus Paceibacterota bacterium]MDD5753065.1 cation diffusion facilitator family transporter [Candidatus Paceibacterota bacterium]